MAFTTTERAALEAAIEDYLRVSRPPLEIRDQVDVVCSVSGQSVEVAESRPVWRNPGERMTIPVARATFVRSSGHWRVFWMRRDLKWHGYEPCPTVPSLGAFFALITEDEHCCFWG
jgi:hypothetical protein